MTASDLALADAVAAIIRNNPAFAKYRAMDAPKTVTPQRRRGVASPPEQRPAGKSRRTA